MVVLVFKNGCKYDGEVDEKINFMDMVSIMTRMVYWSMMVTINMVSLMVLRKIIIAVN